MIRERYESPKMTFEEVKVNEAVANTCWGYHGTDTKLYTDIPGTGYVSFQIGGSKCALNVINVTYYESQTAEKENKSRPATSAEISALNDILKNAGGSSGNPFDGEGKEVIVDGPGNKFS